MLQTLSVEWKGGMAFESSPPSGNRFVMDLPLELGGNDAGPTPVETLLSAVAGCSAMDVIGVLRKKRQNVTGYRVEVEWTRGPEGEWPRPVLSILVRHVVRGNSIDPGAVARAVELSAEKYCTVIATLRACPNVCSEWELEEEPKLGA